VNAGTVQTGQTTVCQLCTIIWYLIKTSTAL